MTKRWKLAAAFLALSAFVYAFLRPDENPIPVLTEYPPLVAAVFWAIMAVIWVWFVEAIVAAIRRFI